MATDINKHRRPKSREVSSRFLSPSSAATTSDHPSQSSPNHALSPHHHKLRSSSSDNRTEKHHRNTPLFDPGLWPSANTTPTTLGDYLGNDRRSDRYDSNPKSSENNNSKNNDYDYDNAALLSRTRSSTDFNRFENRKSSNGNSKENHEPVFSGGSMRYTGKFKFTNRSSTSRKSSDAVGDDSNHVILPGRLSVDENALRRRSFTRRSDSFSDESECSDLGLGLGMSSPITKNLPAQYMAPTFSSRKSGKEIPSKYMNPVSLDSSLKKSTIKNMMKRANSLTLPSKWSGVSSPGRVESPTSFSSFKPPTSPSRTKNLLNLGLDLIKGKKSGPSSSGCLSPLGPGTGANTCTIDSVHQLRMIHNRLIQWRFVNARAEIVKESIANQAERNLVCATYGITKLQHSVFQKRLQIEKRKLEMKLSYIFHSQIKLLETWGDLERQHMSAVTRTKDALHSVVCRVPLIDGAKMERHSTSIALRHALDLAASIKSMISVFSTTADDAGFSISELAKVAMQEKFSLEECLEHFKAISTLELQERSLKCSVMQMQSIHQEQLAATALHEQLQIPV